MVISYLTDNVTWSRNVLRQYGRLS